MTQEEFFEEENRRHIENDKAYRAHLKLQGKLQERQVIASENQVKAQQDMIAGLVEFIESQRPVEKKSLWQKLKRK